MNILDPRVCEIEWLREFVRAQTGRSVKLDKLTSGDAAKLVKAIQRAVRGTAQFSPDRDW